MQEHVLSAPELERVGRLAEALDAAICAAYAAAAGPEGPRRRVAAGVKSLVAATAFDDLLRFRGAQEAGAEPSLASPMRGSGKS